MDCRYLESRLPVIVGYIVSRLGYFLVRCTVVYGLRSVHVGLLLGSFGLQCPVVYGLLSFPGG